MRVEELRKQMQKMGVRSNNSERTIRRWGEDGLIEDHRPGQIGQGRGHADDWPEAALEDACAVLAVYQYNAQTKRLSPEVIKHIKAVAEHLYVSPLAYYILPRVLGPLLRFGEIPYEDVRLQFATEESLVLNLVPGENVEEKTGLFNALICTWIAAREKVRFSRKWDRVPCPSLTGREEDREVAMRIKNKVKAVKARWPIKTPARIYLSHRYFQFEPLEIALIGPRDYVPVGTLDRTYIFERSYIMPSDQDEVILLENDVDTRKLFIIADTSGNESFFEGLRREQLDELPEYYTMS